ncbi:MAG: hypothetical protein ACRDMV_14155, partial [Streptosporangiales bacterium]
ASRLARLIPEATHRYPTYRLDIARGRIARADRSLDGRLAEKVSMLMEHMTSPLLFCPIGIGRHVDHIITRQIGNRFGERVIYYADFPYNQSHGPDAAFIASRGLVQWLWDEGIEDKPAHIRGYRTQAYALFPDSHIPQVPETYWNVTPSMER